MKYGDLQFIANHTTIPVPRILDLEFMNILRFIHFPFNLWKDGKIFQFGIFETGV